jgi:hypothetical protein
VETRRIICDVCNADITDSPNWEDYYLELGSRQKVRRRGLTTASVTDPVVDPPLERSYQFCNVQCLATWVSRLPRKPESERA